MSNFNFIFLLLIVVPVAYFLLVDVKKKGAVKAQKDMGTGNLMVRQSELAKVACMAMALLFGGLYLVPDESASMLLRLVILAFAIFGASAYIALVRWEIRVEDDIIHHTPILGRSKTFTFNDINEIESWSGDTTSLSVEGKGRVYLYKTCAGYEEFITRLQEAGIGYSGYAGDTWRRRKADAARGMQENCKAPDEQDLQEVQEPQETQETREEKETIRTLLEEILSGKLDLNITFYKTANGIGLVLFCVLIFLPAPINSNSRNILGIYTLIAITLFLATVWYIIRNGSIIGLGIERAEKKKPPHLTAALLGSTIGILFIAVNRYQVIHSSMLWTIIIATAVALSAIVLFSSRESGVKRSVLIMLITCTVLFSYGAVIVTNCALDFTDSERMPAIIERKTESSSSLFVRYEDGSDDTFQVGTVESDFENTKVGDRILLCTKPGFLGFRWVTCTRLH